MDTDASFTERDWAGLTPHDKRALRIMLRRGGDDRSIADMPGLGRKSIHSLMQLGLVEVVGTSLAGPTYSFTDKGWSAVGWMRGNRR